MIITIDGYSCQGKSYVGRALAEEMGLEFLATGRLVRYVAFLFNQLQDGISDTEVLLKKAVEIMKSTAVCDIVNCEYLETEETERTLKITSEYPFVFEQVVRVIRAYAADRDIVLDGRFTFNIFPHAHRSYYFRSSVQRRASLEVSSKNMSYDEALRYIAFRDSFEKQYDLPERVRIIDLAPDIRAGDLIQYLKNDIRNEG